MMLEIEKRDQDSESSTLLFVCMSDPIRISDVAIIFFTSTLLKSLDLAGLENSASYATFAHRLQFTRAISIRFLKIVNSITKTSNDEFMFDNRPCCPTS